MGVLSGPEIARLVKQTKAFKEGGMLPSLPSIEIEPFDQDRCGPNSYDVLLSNQLRIYAIRSAILHHYGEVKNQLPDLQWQEREGVDLHYPTPTVALDIPREGRWLFPGVLYLGRTVERTLCRGLVPWLDGRSSIGRCGLSVHVTAGRGDDNWDGTWTCEITAVTHPVKVYPNERFGQLTYFTLIGDRKPYTGRYSGQVEPTASRLHLDVEKDLK